MELYRLCRAPFVALDGEGARRYGGRWNSVGQAVVYASSTRALAALEYLVHVDVADVPADLVLLTLAVPDDVSEARVRTADLPATWSTAPESAACRALGDRWAQTGDALTLRVPAVPIPEEDNVLLNPRHPDAARVRVVAVRPFEFDARLLRGFTLIEVLVVIVVIAILAALVAPNIFRNVGVAKDAAARAQMEMLSTALDSYRLDTGVYPPTADGLSALWKAPAGAAAWRGPYLRKAVPNDPWGHPYAYAAPGQANPGGYDLQSYGRDGRPGGEGEDADLRAWENAPGR